MNPWPSGFTTVPQATVSQRAPFYYWYFIKFLEPNMCGLHWRQILMSWLFQQSKLTTNIETLLHTHSVTVRAMYTRHWVCKLYSTQHLTKKPHIFLFLNSTLPTRMMEIRFTHLHSSVQLLGSVWWLWSLTFVYHIRFLCISPTPLPTVTRAINVLPRK